MAKKQAGKKQKVAKAKASSSAALKKKSNPKAVQASLGPKESQLLRNSLLATHHDAIKQMEPNTRKQYVPKMHEYNKWRQSFYAGKVRKPQNWDWVTTERVHYFLKEHVIGRLSRVMKKGEEEFKTVSHSLVKQYLQALVMLYDWQKTEERFDPNKNPKPSADGKTLKNLMDMSAKDLENRRRQNFEDRAKDSLLEGYRQRDLPYLAAYFFSLGTDHGMRNRSTQLLLHHNVMRWDSGKMVEFPDMFHLILEEEGPIEHMCICVAIMMRQGKANKYGRLEYNGMFRNKDVRICGVGGIGFWLLWRYHVMKEEVPDFIKPQDWFFTKLINSPKSRFLEYSYDGHIKAVDKGFSALLIESVDKAHAARKTGVQYAQSRGLKADEIRKATHHNEKDVLSTAYMAELPLDQMRVAAGFRHDRREYWLRRALLDPPLELQQKIFPWLEKALTDQHNAQRRLMCTSGFLKLLQKLRTVILQDAVFLLGVEMEVERRIDGQEAKSFAFRDHPIFQDELFSSPLFLSFAEDLKKAAAEAVDPADTTMENVMPALNDKLDLQTQAILGAHAASNAELKKWVEEKLDEKLDEKLGGLESRMNETFARTANTALAAAAANAAANHLPRFTLGRPPAHLSPSSSSSAPADGTAAASSAVLPGVVAAAAAPTAAPPAVDATTRAGVPVYTFARNISTVRELWKEWHVGIGHHPPVVEFISKYGVKGLPSAGEKKWYQRRSKIISWVKELAAERYENKFEQAVQLLDQVCTKNKYSLDSLSKQKGKIKL